MAGKEFDIAFLGSRTCSTWAGLVLATTIR